MAAAFPANVHISSHPCLRAKLSQLRSASADARSVKLLVHEIATIVLCEALAASLSTATDGEVTTTPPPRCLNRSADFAQGESTLGYPFAHETISPARVSIIPILRSGLSMLDALTALLPQPAPVHHLGLFREPVSLQPVEYYNNLPYHSAPPAGASAAEEEHLAIILDPIIATGGTAVAAIQTLREWGVTRVLYASVLGSEDGVRRAADEWAGVQVWVGAVDRECDDRGMIKPGVGDIGDRLYGTKGK